MRVIYSFNKTGEEAVHWDREIRAASTEDIALIPFNHGAFADLRMCWDAGRLDSLFRAEDAGLKDLHEGVKALITSERADALFVTNCPPYHPEFLRSLGVYKALYSTDDPGATYLRTIPYLHAYDHVFYCSPLYSGQIDMAGLMKECGVRTAEWLPLGVFDFERRADRDEAEVFSARRDIDVVYVGGCFLQKLPVLAALRRRLGRRLRLRGLFSWKCNLYMNVRYRSLVWIRPVSLTERIALYQRARIGVNLHWNEHGLGNQRLYHLPANGALQISDCAPDLHRIFEPGAEIEGFGSIEELLEIVTYYLSHEDERFTVAQAGYRRVMRDYRFVDVTRRAIESMRRGMSRR